MTRPRLDIFAPEHVAFHGTGRDVPNAELSGRVVLHLTESVTIREFSVVLCGVLILSHSTEEERVWRPLSRIVHLHVVSLLDKRTQLKAGTHSFPFAMSLSSQLPCSLPDNFPHASLTYRLRATAVRTTIFQNLVASQPLAITRSYAPQSFEFQNLLEIENIWPEIAVYALALPHKAWAAGDTLAALIKIYPLTKDVRPLTAELTIREDIEVGTAADTSAPRTIQRVIATVSHTIPEPGPTPSSSSTEADPVSDRQLIFPVTLAIPADTLPSYRDPAALVSARHRLDMLLTFARTEHGSGRALKSEMACSFPLRILAPQHLHDARAATRAARRALFGGAPAGDDPPELPSYAAHVRDRIPETTGAAPAAGGARMCGGGTETEPAPAPAAQLAPPAPASSTVIRASSSRVARSWALQAFASARAHPAPALELVSIPAYDHVPTLSSIATLPSYDEVAFSSGLGAMGLVR